MREHANAAACDGPFCGGSAQGVGVLGARHSSTSSRNSIVSMTAFFTSYHARSARLPMLHIGSLGLDCPPEKMAMVQKTLIQVSLCERKCKRMCIWC